MQARHARHAPPCSIPPLNVLHYRPELRLSYSDVLGGYSTIGHAYEKGFLSLRDEMGTLAWLMWT
jgi:hypothetical protein